MAASKGRYWRDLEVEALLDLLLQSGRASRIMGSHHLPTKAIFARVARQLAAKGWPRTADQCRSKFKRVKADFFAAMEQWQGIPRMSARPPFFADMRRLWEAAGRPSWEDRRQAAGQGEQGIPPAEPPAGEEEAQEWEAPPPQGEEWLVEVELEEPADARGREGRGVPEEALEGAARGSSVAGQSGQPPSAARRPTEEPVLAPGEGTPATTEEPTTSRAAARAPASQEGDGTILEAIKGLEGRMMLSLNTLQGRMDTVERLLLYQGRKHRALERRVRALEGQLSALLPAATEQ
ncbi:uncharacterized protein LOC129341878 [Eublepharis macularius]|uniref:Uncharacterized protein LOC129328033 n=1 Tax=Eublepharis macularius TaxID=481883 RepID=A0AA97KC90_EUBMA|nr:uncharacterized protein LOC129328033 [Eublepharis macularius]XP_054853212.1 uncharacterized protein LOC129341878 [Eublepharis macularius]